MKKSIKITDVLQSDKTAIWVGDDRQRRYLQYALAHAGALDRKALNVPDSDYYYTIDGAKTVDIGKEYNAYTMLDVDFSDVLSKQDNKDMEDMLHYPLTIMEYASDCRERAITINAAPLENLLLASIALAGVKYSDGETWADKGLELNVEDCGGMAVTNRGRVMTIDECKKSGMPYESIYNVGMSAVLDKDQILGLVTGKLKLGDVIKGTNQVSDNYKNTRDNQPAVVDNSDYKVDNNDKSARELDFERDYNFDDVM